MKLFDILNNTEYKLVQGEDVEVKNITLDSRRVSRGSLFFCIKGLKSNGHKFIGDATTQQAAAIVIEEDVEDLPSGITIIRVNSSRNLLSYAAANFYGNPAKKFELVGVTGTNGKTSSTYFMESILKVWGKKTGVIGTIEFRVGSEKINIRSATSTTPDTIELQQIFKRMSEEDVDFVSMEVTSHALSLEKVTGVNFKVGIFTNLTQDHLDYHGTMENYRDTKAEFFTMCENSVINADDEYADFMIKKARGKVITYSIDKPSDLRAMNLTQVDNGSNFDLEINAKVESFFLPVRGRFSVYNALGVVGAALALNIPIEVIKEGLRELQPAPGRMHSVKNNRGFDVIVDYSHTPDSLKNIILAVREFTKNRVITVFGCGGDRDKTKRPIMGQIASELSDFCILTSDNPRTENPESILDEIEVGTKRAACEYVKIIDRQQAIEEAISMARSGDTIIIAGKGHENYQIFADRTVHFDDREVAETLLS